MNQELENRIANIKDKENNIITVFIEKMTPASKIHPQKSGRFLIKSEDGFYLGGHLQEGETIDAHIIAEGIPSRKMDSLFEQHRNIGYNGWHNTQRYLKEAGVIK